MLEPQLVVGVLAAVLAGSWSARWLRLPAPLVLVAVGSLIGIVPALTNVTLPPETVLLIFLPVLLYWESLTTSLREIRRMMRGIILTGTLLVAATAAAIAGVLHLLGVPWGTAWIIGAALGPTDATAVAAMSRGLPRRAYVVLQAESLINDGTALVIYALALGTATGAIQPTVLDTGGRFVVSFGGGVLIGLVVGWLLFRVRIAVEEPVLVNLVALLVPFAAYLAAEEVGGSGVVAVVTAGLYASQAAPRAVVAQARTQGSAFWGLTTFVLNAALFVLVGVQLPRSSVQLTTDTLAHAALLVCAAYGTMVVTRYAFLNLSIGIIRLLDRRPHQRTLRTTHRGRLVSTVAGFRGAVSVAVALSVPADYVGRDLIVFVVGTAVVVTLVLNGFALPRVIRWARLPADTSQDEELRTARVAELRPALAALPDLARTHGVDQGAVDLVRDDLTDRLVTVESDGAEGRPADRAAMAALRLGVVAVERDALVSLRDDGTIDDTVLRLLQAELDAEENRLRGLLDAG